MRRRTPALFLVVALFVTPGRAEGWGLTTHRWVNEAAVDVVPEPLRSFLREHREKLSDLSVEPDTVRRDRHGRREAIRHFVHLDRYGKPPFPEVSERWDRVVTRFGRDTVKRRGTLPWTILRLSERLERAFRDGKSGTAVRCAGLVGHYLADAFMPLHATSNHDGQKTGDDGVHHRLEDVVDERLTTLRRALRDELEAVEPAPFTVETVFGILRESHRRVGDVLGADRRARAVAKPGTEAHADALAREAEGLVRERLSGAAVHLGRLWWSAWDAAGRPELGGP